MIFTIIYSYLYGFYLCILRYWKTFKSIIEMGGGGSIIFDDLRFQVKDITVLDALRFEGSKHVVPDALRFLGDEIPRKLEQFLI